MSFQAKRTYTSGELLALQRQQVERTQLPLRSDNLQDSSELTARVRKFYSVYSQNMPFSQTYGNSTNMVKWRDSSVVQAMKEGQAYRAAQTHQIPVKYPLTCDGVPNQFLRTDLAFPTAPKAITCCPDNRGKYWVGGSPNPHVQAFNLQQHFGLRKNDNKVVMSNAPPFVPGTCASCDLIEK